MLQRQLDRGLFAQKPNVRPPSRSREPYRRAEILLTRPEDRAIVPFIGTTFQFHRFIRDETSPKACEEVEVVYL